MENRDRRDSAVHSSSLFNMDENIAAAAVGAVTLAASFIPYVSYLSCLIPLGAAAAERKSVFARLCDAQIFACSAVICLCSFLTVIITPYAESAMETAAGNRLMIFGAIGILMSLLRVICVVFVILTAYNAFKNKCFEIPCVTPLIKKIMKYSY